MIENRIKFHFIVSGHKYEHLCIELDGFKIWESSEETLLGICMDRNLYFDNHVNKICRIAGRKLTALARLSSILPFHKMKVLIQNFFNSQFHYCPLVWMFCSKTSNEIINKLHERSLRILYKDDSASFKELLTKDNSVTIHIHNIRLLAIEMYNAKNGLAVDLISNLLPRNEHRYCLRNAKYFKRPNSNTTHWAAESLLNIGPLIWDTVPPRIKALSTLKSFKININSWVPDSSPCRIWKVFIRDLGYLQFYCNFYCLFGLNSSFVFCGLAQPK